MKKFFLSVRMGLSIAAIMTLAISSAGCASGSSDATGTANDPTASNSDSTAPLTPDKNELNDYIRSLGYLKIADQQSRTKISCTGAECKKSGQEGNYYCNYSTYTETAQYENFVAFQPNSATLWPGSVVLGKDAQNGVLTPVPANLAPVTFSISLENMAGSPVGKMSTPSLSAFRTERNRILATELTGATPAMMKYDVTQINNESQLLFKLGASAKMAGIADVAGSFDFSTTGKSTKIMVDFVQAYYTIDVDTPRRPQDFFTDEVATDDLRGILGTDNPPLYIQSITYGRHVIFSVETNEKVDDVKGALNAALDKAILKGLGDVSGDLEANYKKVLSNSTIRAFVFGGSASEASAAISSYEGIVEYIKKGGNYSKESPGAPIAYKLAYLDNAVTKFSYTTTYQERNCVVSRGTLTVQLLSMKHLGGQSLDLGNNIEIFGNVSFRYPTSTSNVSSCSSGGSVRDLWRVNEGSYIKIAKSGTWTPSSATTVSIPNVSVSASSKLCLSANLQEDDYYSSEMNANEAFGSGQMLLEVPGDWQGTKIIQVRGEKENAIDIAIRVSLD